MPTVLDVRSAHRAGLGTFSQFRPFNSFPFFPTCIFLVVDSVSKSCLSSTRPKPAAAPLPSTQKRTRKKLKLEARCNAEQSIINQYPGEQQSNACCRRCCTVSSSAFHTIRTLMPYNQFTSYILLALRIPPGLTVRHAALYSWEQAMNGNRNKSSTTSRIYYTCLLYTSPSPRDQRGSRMPSSA